MLLADMLRDSFRESLDRRSFYLTLVISSVVILSCACVAFEPVPIQETLQMILARNNQAFQGYQAINYQISDVRPIGKEPGQEEFEGGWSYLVTASPLDQVQRRALFFEAIRVTGAARRAGELKPFQVPGLSPDGKTVVDPPSEQVMLRQMENCAGWPGVFRAKIILEGQDSHQVTFRIWFKPVREDLFVRGHRVDVLFGTLVIDQPRSDVGDSVLYTQNILAGYLVGWMGILVAIVAASGFTPNMLQKGTVDLSLSRPIPRWKLFMGKYLGGLIFILVTSIYLIGGTWLALAARSGIWSPGYLLTIPLLLFLFAALHSISTLIGLQTRSSIQAIMVSALAWVVVSVLGSAHYFMHQPASGANPNGVVMKTVDTLHAVLPPFRELDKAVTWCLLKANGITPARQMLYPRLRGPYPEVDWVPLFGVTGAWTVGLLGLSCWMFSRRDY